jgi:hypothetical protein
MEGSERARMDDLIRVLQGSILRLHQDMARGQLDRGYPRHHHRLNCRLQRALRAVVATRGTLIVVLAPAATSTTTIVQTDGTFTSTPCTLHTGGEI